MKLTIGMATIDDYDGPYFTIQALRAYHQLINHNIEFVVVDNNPKSKASQPLQNYLKHCPNSRYIPMPTPDGTTQTRNRVFQEATGDVVICMDSHVLLMPGAIEKLINFYEANPACLDLLTGPLLDDDLVTPLGTHFDDVWRSEMWGIWGRAWGCPTTYDPNFPGLYVHPPMKAPPGAKVVNCPQNFSILPTPNGHLPHTLAPNPQLVTDCPVCTYTFPKECTPQALLAAGFKDLAYSNEPFEIPGQGLGLFSCRKEAWLGFNEHFRGFGGEEMYIHEKYRQAGRKNLCLPFLKWGHRFGRPYGTPYVPTLWHKVRNYVLGHLELNLPLDRVYEHFVASGAMPKEHWEVILKNPIESGNVKLKVVPREPPPRAGLQTPSDWIAWVKEHPRDLDQHADKLFELSSQCAHVTEFTHRRESTIGLLGAKQLVSYQAENDSIVRRLVELYPQQLRLTSWSMDNFLPEIAETDMLFLDTVGNYDRLYAELITYHKSVRRWIVMHDTQIYGTDGEGGLPGMLGALRDFMQAFPEWSVIYHTSKQYGLTVIGKLDIDKPKLPSFVQMASNFAQAMATYAGDGMQNVTKEQLTDRLSVCTICDQRTNDRCAACGCGLTAKASMRAMECPLGRWPLLLPIA